MPDDLHEWVSFEDPDEAAHLGLRRHVPHQPVDLHLRRRLPRACSPGPPRISSRAAAATAPTSSTRTTRPPCSAHAERLTPEQWQFHEVGHRKAGPTKTNKAGEIKTRLVDGACIFLNRPGFAGGIGCALHSAALEAGERPLDWKPQVCWQLPLRLEDHTDDDGHVTSTLREWKRRDWGEGGAEFHWWCTEDPEAFVDREPVYVTMRDEIVEMVGPDGLRPLREPCSGPRAGAVPSPPSAPAPLAGEQTGPTDDDLHR